MAKEFGSFVSFFVGDWSRRREERKGLRGKWETTGKTGSQGKLEERTCFCRRRLCLLMQISLEHSLSSPRTEARHVFPLAIERKVVNTHLEGRVGKHSFLFYAHERNVSHQAYERARIISTYGGGDIKPQAPGNMAALPAASIRSNSRIPSTSRLPPSFPPPLPTKKVTVPESWGKWGGGRGEK